jgi:hypothetical protein
MQGGHGYGAYGYGAVGGYVYDAGAYAPAGGYYPDGGYQSAPAYDEALAAPGRRAHDIPAPPGGLELEPSEACPKNYVVFDQTSAHSRVMFHPSLARKLGAPPESSYGGAGACTADADDDGCSRVRPEEDPEEIDALLSLSSEDDAASTARSAGSGRDDGSSADSACSSGAGGKKKARIKKMMRALKGIVPGAKQKDAPAALDEAVWYLRSLKVEAAKKLGARGSGS